MLRPHTIHRGCTCVFCFQRFPPNKGIVDENDVRYSTRVLTGRPALGSSLYRQGRSSNFPILLVHGAPSFCYRYRSTSVSSAVPWHQGLSAFWSPSPLLFPHSSLLCCFYVGSLKTPGVTTSLSYRCCRMLPILGPRVENPCVSRIFPIDLSIDRPPLSQRPHLDFLHM